ncbi:MAG: ABC transporter permease [Bacteroidota bacterium]
MLTFKLSWRNIWRNKRRTWITVSSILLAVLLSVVTRSMQVGSYDQMIANAVGSYAGYIQVQHEQYHDESNLNNTFYATDSLLQQIAAISNVEQVVPRIESFALAAGDQKSKATMVVGFDPQAEKALSNPANKLVQGTYPTDPDHQGVLISDNLAEYLNVTVSDTLVLLGQGYHAISAAGAYPIQGIIDFGPSLGSQSMVFMPLHTAQFFFGADQRLTSAALTVSNISEIGETTQKLNTRLSDPLQALPWQEIMPELVQAIEADSGSGMITILVLYIVVGFGILSTVLMMTAERQYEFGVMVSIGTKRMRLAGMLITELIMISILGISLGCLGSLPIIYYFNYNPIKLGGEMAEMMTEYGMDPILPFSVDPTILLNQALVVLFIIAVIGLYPLWHAWKLQPLEAMHR